MNKKRTRQNKGITLIALIITIIVMLILVAVTITVAVNGGLFGYARNAAIKTNEAKDAEQKLATLGDDLTVDQLIGKYTTVHKWTRDGDTVKCSHCDLEYDLGDEIPYVADTVSTPYTITATRSGIKKAITKETDPYSLSDFNTTIRDTEGNQVIEQETGLTWVVLGIEDVDGDGINESLLITTSDILNCNNSWTNCIYFYGADGANNAVGELNSLCAKLYSNSKYGTARNITIEDVNSCLNFKLASGQYYKNGTGHLTGNLTTKLNQIDDIWDDIVERGTFTPDGKNTAAALGEYVLNGYEYYHDYDTDEDGLTLAIDGSDKKTKITQIENDLIFSDRGYWLASAGVRVYGDYARFGPGYVSDDGCVSAYGGLFGSDGYEYRYDYGFRPVVSLKSDIPGVE